ncbi:MAG: hypothetical protein V1792_12970 [Pseudomonadota bacterium]
MRFFVVAAVLSFVALGSIWESAGAVGYDVAGKEKCVCSPLTARGIYPDTLNNLKEALILPRLGYIAERLAQEIKAVLGQFGIRSAGDPRGSVQPAKTIIGLNKDADKEKERPAVSKKGEKSREKKRRVKMPPRAL